MSDNGELRTDQVNRAYAQALYEMAEQQDNIDEVADEMDQLGELLRSDRGFRHLMTSPALGVGERAGIIERVLGDRVSVVVYRFIQVLNHKQRLGALRGIVQAFGDLVSENRGLVEVDAFVPQRLDETETQSLTERLGEILGKQVVLHQYVDESLIGGLKLRIGDQLIDGSVATQLKRLRRGLAQSGHEKARQGGQVEEE